ncbi:phosphatidic acid phosphatase type 2/haloperoxidase [Lucifera butyrica]|uniref:Phosphatidic acid phosphatase type 2/haloperoxidase n=1 Tax=Lucifera butyrica TaxID=1351585 RepID=A0A498RDL4_9FIRM|nr:undecaprenyl-diphosphatase [Lucifera butyrica]VBB09065.1 phosphatidic acid phosphatase type 2/haloperoxidase [Lucifera butyrica]
MHYDMLLFHFINNFSGHLLWLDRVMIYIAEYGPAVYGLYLVALWFTGADKRELAENRRKALYAFTAALIGLGVNQIIGFAWFRNRPYINHPAHLLVPVNPDASFPSDHATGSFSIARSLVASQAYGGKGMLGFAFLLAFSRVYVGVHYPTDVIGGMIVGIMSSWLVERYHGLLEKPIILIFSIWAKVEKAIPVLAFERGIRL